MALAVTIINFRTVEATQACIGALLTDHSDDIRLFVLDNGSQLGEAAALTAFGEKYGQGKITVLATDKNLGFAGGSNFLIRETLQDASIDAILFLNSDTRPTPGFIAAMRAKLDPANRMDLVAAKMLDEKDSSIDSLGITLFRSTLTSNRKREDEILLGPSGGCALLTRRLLEDLQATHGEWFDETFFCYAEDTDLAVRARWLGYRPAYADDAVVYHARSLSSGGPDNDFVLYHGIRNSIWWLVKNAPLGWFLRSLPWFIFLHGAIWLRHLRRGKARVLWRLYRDAIKGIAAMRRKRAVIKKARRVPASEFASWVEPHFYQRDYVRQAWNELFRPTPKR
jgi:N-acetylglucosaminyl-diphospho-decaprenol L-rhamnosyltransferase